MAEIREFTQDDWGAWESCAEPFVDGQPLIFGMDIDGAEFYAIADLTGIEFHVMTGDYDYGTEDVWQMNVIVRLQRKMRELLESLLDELDISEGLSKDEVECRLNNMDGVVAV